MQHIVSGVELYESRCTEDNHDGINIVELLFAVVDGKPEVLGSSCGQNVDGVSDRRAWEELRLQFIGNGTGERRHLHATLRECVGKHHARSSGMCDDGDVLSCESRQREDTTHGGELLA